jgi:putative restriction endonuclease
MAANLVVAITDYNWFQALRVRDDWSEVNFWSPSGTGFRALQPGELFLFKLHSPRNFIVGGGVFANAMTLPCSMAWETFGQANGASDFAEMRSRILQYRNADPNDRSDFQIGCRILTQAFF